MAKGHWENVGTVKRWVPEPDNSGWVWVVIGGFVLLLIIGAANG